jgi:hypothetical protein
MSLCTPTTTIWYWHSRAHTPPLELRATRIRLYRLNRDTANRQSARERWNCATQSTLPARRSEQPPSLIAPGAGRFSRRCAPTVCLKCQLFGHRSSSPLSTSGGLTMSAHKTNIWQACVRDAAIASVAVNFSYAVFIPPFGNRRDNACAVHFRFVSCHCMLVACSLQTNPLLPRLYHALYEPCSIL